MKTQFIREALRGKVDPVILKIIEAQNEQIHVHQKLFTVMGNELVRLTELMIQFSHALGSVEEMQKWKREKAALEQRVAENKHTVESEDPNEPV